MRLQIILKTIAISIIFLMTGCGSKATGPATNTGFFENYKKSEMQIQAKKALPLYTKIQVIPVRVISGQNISNESASQKKMYKEISNYVTDGYKKIVQKNKNYTLVDVKSENTLVLRSAISTVEIHPDDKNWNQLTPIAMGLDSVSFNAYMYEYVRVLGESKLVDASTNKVISRSMKIQQRHTIKITGDDLVFADIKPALDSWLVQIKNDLSSK